MLSVDLLWKTIIEDLFEDFMHFFFPSHVREIDFMRPPEFLDKELAKLFPASRQKQRVADKLVKVWLKDGTASWVLIHIEVQGYRDTHFEQRMFQTWYRLSERYGRPIAALAIFTDDDDSYRPAVFRQSFWGTEVSYQYPVFKVADHPPGSHDPDNPFTVAIETAWHSLKRHKLDDLKRLDLKLTLVKNLLRSKLSKDKIRNLLHFIDGYVKFDNPDLQDTFAEQLDQFSKTEKTMTTAELVTKHRLKEAHLLGKKEGKKEGKIEGKKEGKIEGLAEGIEKGIRMLLVNGFQKQDIARYFEVSLGKVEEVWAKMQQQPKQN